jgi:MoaA/NifB/PqqE/SkfB family radical SAM enzyme
MLTCSENDLALRLRFRERLGNLILSLGMRRLLRFVPISPEWANINVTENCNSRCITCFAWKNKIANELSTVEIKNVLRQLKEIGVKSVIFIGGEPLLRNDIGDLVKETRLLKFYPIMLVTNGLLLESKAEELVESGVTHLAVSVDGVGRTNEVIRGIKGNYERSIRGIETVLDLKKRKNSGISVTLLTTMLLNQNVDEIPQLVETARKLGVHWTCNLLDPNVPIFRGIAFSDLLVNDEEKIDKTIDFLEETRKNSPWLVTSCDHKLEYARHYLKTRSFFPRSFHCVHGYRVVWLTSRGDVHPGCWQMDPLGNVRRDKLRDVVRSGAYRKTAERMYMNQCPGCTNLHAFNVAAMHPITHRSCGRVQESTT